MNRLYIWSDIPGQWYKASTESDATGQAAGSDKTPGTKTLVENVTSMSTLVALFTRLHESNDEWNSVNFHTHGAGGQVALGSDILNFVACRQLEGQNFERLFASDCVITFDGCSVAEGAAGEYFLVKIGSTLLTRGGGQIRGSTGGGFGSWGGGESLHPTGNWVTAYVGPGGTVRLSDNATNLQRSTIEERIVSLRKKNSEYDELGWLQANEKRTLFEAEQNAVTEVSSDSWFRRFEATRWLEWAEGRLGVIRRRESSQFKHGPH